MRSYNGFANLESVEHSMYFILGSLIVLIQLMMIKKQVDFYSFPTLIRFPNCIDCTIVGRMAP